MNQKFIGAFPQYVSEDVWDTEKTKRFWIDKYCETSYELIEEKAREINNFNPSSNKRYFGLKRDSEY